MTNPLATPGFGISFGWSGCFTLVAVAVVVLLAIAGLNLIGES